MTGLAEWASAVGVELEEGAPCPVAGCDGRLGFQPVEGCTCFKSAPCNACLENPLVCLACWFDPEKDDVP